MKVKPKELTALTAALEQGARVSIQFDAENHADAQQIMETYCKGLGRTFEPLESQGGEYKWLSMVSHDADRLDISVFYEEPELN